MERSKQARAIPVLAALLVACASVPDITFADGDAGPPLEAGADASSSGGLADGSTPRDAAADVATPPACTPSPPGLLCCGGFACIGCSASQCTDCSNAGCHANEVCCPAGMSNNVMCKSGNAC